MRTTGTSIQKWGKALKADVVVGVDLKEFNIYSGQTVFQGQGDGLGDRFGTARRARCSTRRPCRRSSIRRTHVIPAGEMQESTFRKKFVRILADHVGKAFLCPRSSLRHGLGLAGVRLLSRAFGGVAAFVPPFGPKVGRSRRAGLAWRSRGQRSLGRGSSLGGLVAHVLTARQIAGLWQVPHLRQDRCALRFLCSFVCRGS